MRASALNSVCIKGNKQCPIMSRTLSTCAVEVRYFTSCALKPLPQSTKRIPDGPSPLTITANTPRTHQVTHFSDRWPAQSFRKWIKDCCHPLRHAHKATLCYIASCKHWQATILQTHRKALRQIRATTGIINKDKQFKTPLHKPFKTVENLSRHVKTFQVYKDPSACTMASKAAQAELARKRCTPSSGVLVLPNTEVDSVAGVVEPSRDTHGYWPQKGASPFPKKGRLKAPADIHPGTQKQELEPKIEPNISQPCQSQRMCSRDENKRIKKWLHQLYQAMSNHVSNSIDLCRWSQPDTLRLVLWNHCPSQPKGSLMAQAHWP